MEFRHTSVLFDECMEYLNIRKNGIYVDGTLGGGGHASGICERLGEDGIFIGVDRDREALIAAEKRLEKYPCKKIYIKRNYADIAEILAELEIFGADGAVLDLGVSSYQLDNPGRGFSYMNDAPLDMRMDADESFSAYDVVNTYTAEDLEEIIRKYGEEKWARRISRFITDARKSEPVETTEELVSIIKSAIPASARREGPHPAKRTFQAIRIEVNDEIGRLEKAVSSFCDILTAGGRLCVISFHSLEDRIVKNVFNEKASSCTCPKGIAVCVCDRRAEVKKLTRKPVTAGLEELENNPRARSAKLRAVEKLDIKNHIEKEAR